MGKVESLAAQDPGKRYCAEVKDGELCEVDLRYDPEEGWLGSCSCEEEFDCEHVAAAMRALLAEHSTAAVRNLSSGVSTAAKAGGKADEEHGKLDRRLMAALGRPLNGVE